MADVFISYKREEIHVASMIANGLRTEGFTTFYDADSAAGILVGEQWDRRLERELQDAKSVVVLWSQRSVASDNVRDEARLAHRRGILVPARIGECEVPLGLGSIQCANLMGWSGDKLNPEWRRMVDLGVKAKIARPLNDSGNGSDAAAVSVNLEFEDGPGLPSMVPVPTGAFVMGTPPQVVQIRQPIAVAKFPVTRAEWRQFMGGASGGDRLPVTGVNWDAAKTYCSLLAAKTGKNYRLPTDVEWEYACRAGTSTAFAFGDELNPSQANFGKRHAGPTPVGTYPPNAFGLHDMHGNVWEWVEDTYSRSLIGSFLEMMDTGKENRVSKTIRGGAWNYGPAPSSIRLPHMPSRGSDALGFRVVRDLA